MASPGNQHCASCIGTLSFPIRQASTSGDKRQVFPKQDQRNTHSGIL